MEIEERHEEVMGYGCDVFGRGTAGRGLRGRLWLVDLVHFLFDSGGNVFETRALVHFPA